MSGQHAQTPKLERRQTGQEIESPQQLATQSTEQQATPYEGASISSLYDWIFDRLVDLDISGAYLLLKTDSEIDARAIGETDCLAAGRSSGAC